MAVGCVVYSLFLSGKERKPMDETSRNTSEIIMQVHNLFRFADPVFRLTAIGTIKLIQYFARMVKEKKLSAMEFEDFGEFLKVTDAIF